jgi:hypothetical protein
MPTNEVEIFKQVSKALPPFLFCFSLESKKKKQKQKCCSAALARANSALLAITAASRIAALPAIAVPANALPVS